MSRLAVPNFEDLPNLLKVLELLVSIEPTRRRNAKKYRDFYSLTAAEVNNKCKLKLPYRKCVELAINCFQNHHFEEAVKMCWRISHEKCIFDPFFYKAVMILLENLDLNDRNETVWNFLSHAQNLQFINKKEVQLEHIIYGLKHNVPDLQSTTQHLISKKRKLHLRKNRKLDPILDAYCALLDYIGWHKSCKADEAAADKAIVRFKNIIEEPGQWDIFVLKLIEMLEYYDRHEEIEPVLLKYMEQNPKNINGYIYFCKYNPNSLNHLERLVKLCPSDIRVLSLVEKWKILGKRRKKCLKYIFMFLDYPTNGKNVNAWRLLGDALHQAISSKKPSALKVITSSWSLRKRSWNFLYFNILELHMVQESYDLIAYKVQVLSTLEPGHEYIKQNLTAHPEVKELLMETSSITTFTRESRISDELQCMDIT